jgi:hypothetical protein
MRLVLDAIAEGGRDKRRVIAAALRLAGRTDTNEIALYRPDREGRFRRVAARFSPR